MDAKGTKFSLDPHGSKSPHIWSGQQGSPAQSLPFPLLASVEEGRMYDCPVPTSPRSFVPPRLSLSYSVRGGCPPQDHFAVFVLCQPGDDHFARVGTT